ncbi:MAG TPA: hypothetical protein VJU61_06205 [Polyangiaceae bacterium]|nr:hypothetical protein [Polyangiaceae bacterium]
MISKVSSRQRQPRAWSSRVRPVLWALLATLAGGAACSDDEDETAACVGGGGPVAGPADTHCQAAQEIGQCVTGADAAALAAAEEEEEEELGIFYGREADDDDCKYHVRFENSCILQNQPVSFTVQLTKKADGTAATGADPDGPEIYLADDPSHVSPSNDFTATEGPAGTYEIGGVVFDRPGRWVVRFHFFEMCSDIPEDAPHGHTAFYIDVP